MAIFVNDTFTDVPTLVLDSHVGETGATWTAHPVNGGVPIISNANRIVKTGTLLLANPYASGSPANADYEVQATLVFFTDEGNVVGITGREDISADTYYYAVYNRFGSTAAFELGKHVAGANTQLGSDYNDTLVATDQRVLKLRMVGNQISLFVDGTLRVGPITDSDIAAAGKAGLFLYDSGSNTTGIHVDDFSATDVAAAGGFKRSSAMSGNMQDMRGGLLG